MTLPITLESFHLEATPDATIDQFESIGKCLSQWRRGIQWWIGDAASKAARRWPDTWQQIFDVDMSPGDILRCKAVSEAYKPHERNPSASWTIHMQNASKPNRIDLVAAHVDAGHTSDEARKTPVIPETKDWLLAVDVNYFIHRYFHSGAGMESASGFDSWLGRLVERLQEKGLTHVVCCTDSRTNHRKQLTEAWEKAYKARAEKDPELIRQLNLAPELLRARNYPVVSVDDMEADDVMASYAKQFAGRVTLLTQDKDMRQCLSATCNMLIDVEWKENPETADMVPVYKWASAKQHTEEGCTYSSATVVGITPEQWPHFQAIAGDSCDGVQGVSGIGSKGAMDLILAHGTVAGVIQACKDGTVNLSEKKVAAVLDFEPFSETMLKLVTLRSNLNVPSVPRI